MNLNKNNSSKVKVVSDKSKKYQRYHLNKKRAYNDSERKIAYRSSREYSRLKREGNEKVTFLSKKKNKKNLITLKKKDRLNEYVGYEGYKKNLYHSQIIDKNVTNRGTFSIRENSNKRNRMLSNYKVSKINRVSELSNKSKKINTILNKKEKLASYTRAKLDKSLKKHVKSNHVYRNMIKDSLIDTIGRNENGDLNLVGIILAILLLIPVLFLLIKIVLITSVVIAVISVFIAVWSFIVALFTVKTEEMALEEAYRLVTQLDAQKNKEVYDIYNQLKLSDENYEVYFLLNDVRASPSNFLFNSNADTYLYFLNAKYEDYNIDNRSRSSKYNRISDEMRGIHNYTFNWVVESEQQEISQVILIEDPETGEFEEQIQTEIVQVAVVRVYWASIDDYLKEYPDEINEEELDKFEPIQDLDRFENKVFLENPLGKNSYATVIEKYGYRDRNVSGIFNEMILSADEGDVVYASSNETVVDVRENMVISNTPLSKQIRYVNLKNIQVKVGQQLTQGQQIGQTMGNLEIRVQERRSWPHSDAILYPAAYIDNLVFSYPEDTGFHDSSGGLTGNLINPPDSVLKWRELVIKACEKYDISGYENLILAIIWEESGGNPIVLNIDENGESQVSWDIMQSSESLGLPPNSIESAEESIDAGVKYFAQGLRIVEENNLDKQTAIQAYNYGHGFISWLIDGDSDYSFDMARIFSREKSGGRTVSYKNPIAQKMGFSWKYEYGNMFYVDLITQHIMANSGELVRIAKEELGYPNGDKYWRWFGLANRVEWCAIFVSWVADQAGYLIQDRILKSASCIEMVRWFTENGKYKLSTEAYVPMEGDLVFFDWNGNGTGKDHVGIVEYSDGRIIQTIEGNSGNAVRRQTYLLDSPVISGYGITRSNNLD